VLERLAGVAPQPDPQRGQHPRVLLGQPLGDLDLGQRLLSAAQQLLVHRQPLLLCFLGHRVSLSPAGTAGGRTAPRPSPRPTGPAGPPPPGVRSRARARRRPGSPRGSGRTPTSGAARHPRSSPARTVPPPP